MYVYKVRGTGFPELRLTAGFFRCRIGDFIVIITISLIIITITITIISIVPIIITIYVTGSATSS